MSNRSFALFALVSGAVALTSCASSGTVPPGATTTAAPSQLRQVRVGDVPAQPAAAHALRAWAADFGTGDLDVLVQKCWTIAPTRVRSMYADTEPIEHAIAQPGIEGQFAYIWQDSTTRVSVKRSEIASGYACPYVSPTADAHIYTGDDAKYRVLRFVERIIDKPVNPDDTEAKYPLQCSGWGPTALSDTARSIAATTQSVDPNSLDVRGGPDDWQVTVRGTSKGGDAREYRYFTTVGPDGYCISDVQ